MILYLSLLFNKTLGILPDILKHLCHKDLFGIFRKFFFIVSLFIVSGTWKYTTIAQNFIQRTYTTKDGLAHNNVRCIVRDTTGFLWLGTWDGLSRFDGYEFRNYYHIPGDSTSLPYFSILNIKVDCYNNLWILTDWKQIVQYDRSSDNFKPIIFPDDLELSANEVINISLDDKGLLLILDDGHIIRLDEKNRKYETYKLLDPSGNPFHIKNYPVIGETFITNDSGLYVTGTTVLEFKKKGDHYSFVAKYPVAISPPIRTIDFDYIEWFRFSLSLSGEKWLFSNTGLYRLDNKRGSFLEYKADFPSKDFPNSKDYYWGTRDNGIFIYNQGKSSLTHLSDRNSKMPLAICIENSNSFSYSNITSRGEALGFTHTSIASNLFSNFMIPDPDSTKPAVYSIMIDRNKNIWLGIRGYENIILINNDNKASGIKYLKPEFHRYSGHIRTIVPVSSGAWIGHYSGLLQHYDYNTGTFKDYLPNVTSCRTIAVNNDGRIFIGTNKLLLFDPESGNTEEIWSKEGNNLGIYKILVEPSGIIWGAMARSMLLRYDTKIRKGEMIEITNIPSNIEDVIQGENGDYWLALLGNGVCRYNYDKGTKQFYTTTNGLSNNTTYCLLKDKLGNIWVSTNDGISKINPGSGNIRTFNTIDGIAISEFNSGAKFESDKGELFFGGMGGYIRFFPDSVLKEDKIISKQEVILTRLEVSGNSYLLKESLNTIDTIIIKRGENNFHVSFSSIDFVHSDRTKYRYMLSGINNNWVEARAKNRNINYANLNPGWYTLHIQASDANGQWCRSRTISIRVQPLFYQTWLFRISVPVIIIILITSVFMIHLKQVYHRETQKQNTLKLQSLQGQMNPHFIFNSLNSINYFISQNDQVSANRYIADFSKLIRSILTNFNSDYISFEKELESLEDYLEIEHLRFGDRFNYKIETDPDIPKYQLNVSPGLVQPVLENAIWHGVRGLEKRKGNVSVKFTMEKERLKCTVEDDGIGIKRAEAAKNINDQQKSRGLSIVTERLKIISNLRKSNYRIIISDLYPGKPETGTKVMIDIPVTRN